MSIFTRRPIDRARLAEAVAAREGWTIQRWLGKSESHSGVGASVALVVSGGELTGEAVLTIARRDAEDARAPEEGRSAAWTGAVDVVSDHLPRRLRAPELRPAQLRTHRIDLVEHPARGTLHELVRRDPGLTAGEAVTVLASVARGLADLHAGGLAGAALGTSDIGFRDDGCPILTGTAALQPLDHAAARADVASFAALATRVCSAVRGEPAARLLAAATAIGHRSWEDVIRAVLQAADPCAISWTPFVAHAGSSASAVGRPSDSDATVLRGSARAPGGTVPGDRAPGADPTRPDDHRWDPEATLLRSSVRALVSASREEDAPSDGAIAPSGEAGVPQLGPATGFVRGAAPARWEADARGSTAYPFQRDASTAAEAAAVDAVAAPPRDRRAPRSQTTASRRRRSRSPSRSTSDGAVGDPARHDRTLATLERLLNGIGDRPVGRVLEAGRTWITERPLLVGVAVFPLLCALLALLLVTPTDEASSDVLGRSSPALLRESGTGPDCENSEPETWEPATRS